MSEKIFIGGAWPYANGSLHLGHVAALLPGDILARYFRLRGKDVLYVSGSDCHGTPISIRAAQEGIEPQEIANKYHEEFLECFKKLGFSYDLYTRTDEPYHHKVVQEVFIELYKKGIIYKKLVEQTYCEHCAQFLPDRYIEGKCPVCGNTAQGDQCEHCSSLLEPKELTEKKCKLCGNTPILRKTKHLFIDLRAFQDRLDKYTNTSEGWRDNALALTRRYLKEGLKERAVTRDLPWGVSVPVDGFEDKKIYVWIEAVAGYFSASKLWAKNTGGHWENFWKIGKDVTAYYVHGKDNIPFHSIILPALLLGLEELHLPDRIISSEYLTIEGKKISTSSNWAIWVPYIIENYNVDSIRYFLTINGPEKRDGDFSWRDFIASNNSELLGAFGNFVNRTLVFVEKYFEGKVPVGKIDIQLKTKLTALYDKVGIDIEKSNFKSAIEAIFSFIRESNKYFDEKQPWIQINENRDVCSYTIYNCIQIIANLSNLLEPFLPFSTEKIRGFLNLQKPEWSYIEIKTETKIANTELLFERIDKKRVQEEVEKLKQF